MEIGNIALGVAVFSGSVALVLYVLVARGRSDLRTPARAATLLLALWVLVASAFHLTNLVGHRFEYEYVTNFSDRALPTLLLIASFWGGQAGSFLLWAAWSAIFGLVLLWGLRRSAWEPFVLAPYLLIATCIAGITLAANPFKLLAEIPPDGKGLNPLLQNYWMAIHPPILFTGFTTMAGPFVFAVAALWRRDYDGWVAMARPWVLLAWACMGTGLALGGFWAYESLGWGGFWGWDPVENSSLVPWLFASALLHGLVLQGARGSLKRSNLLLAVAGYLSVVYSTFLTRSGILGNFSIHSFVELGLMNYLVAFIAVFAAIGIGMLAWRWRSIGRRVIFANVLSREFGLLLSTVLLVSIMLIVLVGTSMPVISLLPGFASRMSLDLGFYGPTVAPFALLLVVVMGVGPLLGWQQQRYGTLLRMLRLPAILAAVAVFACLLLNVIYPVALLFVAAAVFAVAANGAMIARIWRTGPLRLGGYLCHVGVGLLFVGIIGTNVYKQTAALQLIQDTPQTVFGRQFVFRGLVEPPDDELKRTAVQVEVTNPTNGSTWVAQAPYYVFEKTNQLIAHPDIQSGLWSDLYLAPSQYIAAPQLAPGRVQLGRAQPVTVLGYTLTFQRFELPNREAMLRGEAPPVVQAVLAVRAPDAATVEVSPTLRVAGDALTGDPVDLPGGATLTALKVDPNAGVVELQMGGVDLSAVDPDELKGRLFVEVSQEPGIKFVWGGIIIAVTGGLLAMLRRWRERRPSDDPAPVPDATRQPRPRPAVLEPGVASLLHIESEANR